MKKQHGFTLVEVMVAVAIMGVLASTIGITMGVLLGQRVKSMAADTKSVLQGTQMVSFSQDDAYVEMKQNGNKAQVVAYSSGGKEILRADGSNVQLTISINNGTYIPLNGPVSIRFDRQTGGLKPLADGTTDYISAIRVSNGNRTITLKISKLTGKVTIE